MEILRKIGKILLSLLLAFLLLAPVGVIFYISGQEQAQYAPPEAIELKAQSYGDPCRIFRTDMDETITLSGKVISTGVFYQELDYRDPYALRLLLSPGQVIFAGDVIGSYKGEPVLATETGVVSSVNLGTDSYIQLESLDDLLLECYVNEKTLAVLQRENLDLRDETGAALQVAKIDPIQQGDQGTRALFTIEAGRFVYGETVENLPLTTGKVFSQALVVESQCIYRLNGGEQCYLRVVNEQGEFVEERKITAGYTNGRYTCITGAMEGEYCDPGYKAVVEGSDRDAGT